MVSKLGAWRMETASHGGSSTEYLLREKVQRVSGSMNGVSPLVRLGPHRAGQATWLGPDEGALMGTLRPPGSV